MKVETVTLQDFVQWGLLGVVVLVLLSYLWRIVRARSRNRSWRRSRRHCAQCGLLEEIEPGSEKYGSCHACGGVTSRGRSRKLG